MPTLEGLVEALGGPATPPEAAPAVETPVETPPTEDTTLPVNEETPPVQDEPPAPAVDAKAQQAFIHMRQQNKQYSNTIKGVASVLGIDSNDEEAILAALNERIMANEAQKNNVPPELYARLQQLEARDQEYTALQKQQQVAAGFETVKTQFGLDQAALDKFAVALVQSGKNPLTMDVNLVEAYKLMHFDELQQKAIAKAVAEEQQRAIAAATHSTAPDNRTGGGNPNEPGKVTSVRDLERFFAENN